MRDIRFRYWNNQAKKYHYGQNQVLECLKQQVTGIYNHEDDGCFIEQFIGLNDKNGRNIFENDIVLTRNGDNAKVKYEAPFFGIIYDEKTELSVSEYTAVFINECEVIGNIHENPDLLEPAN